MEDNVVRSDIKPDSIFGMLTNNGWACCRCDDDAHFFTNLSHLYGHLRAFHNMDTSGLKRSDDFIIKSEGGPF